MGCLIVYPDVAGWHTILKENMHLRYFHHRVTAHNLNKLLEGSWLETKVLAEGI